MNYCCTLKLNNSVTHKRVQQLYSQDQSQEVIDQPERQASSARRTLENIWRVDEARLSRNSPKYPRTPRATERYKYYAKDDMWVMYGESQEQITQPVQAVVPDTEVSITRSRDCFRIYNRGSWLSWSNNAHGMQRIRRELGWQSQWFNRCTDEIEHKSPWRIFRELRYQSVWDIYRRNTAMAKATWPTRCQIHRNPSTILGYMTQRQCQWVVQKECRMSQQTN